MSEDGRALVPPPIQPKVPTPRPMAQMATAKRQLFPEDQPLDLTNKPRPVDRQASRAAFVHAFKLAYSDMLKQPSGESSTAVSPRQFDWMDNKRGRTKGGGGGGGGGGKPRRKRRKHVYLPTVPADKPLTSVAIRRCLCIPAALAPIADCTVLAIEHLAMLAVMPVAFYAGSPSKLLPWNDNPCVQSMTAMGRECYHALRSQQHLHDLPWLSCVPSAVSGVYLPSEGRLPMSMSAVMRCCALFYDGDTYYTPEAADMNEVVFEEAQTAAEAMAKAIEQAMRCYPCLSGKHMGPARRACLQWVAEACAALCQWCEDDHEYALGFMLEDNFQAVDDEIAREIAAVRAMPEYGPVMRRIRMVKMRHLTAVTTYCVEVADAMHHLHMNKMCAYAAVKWQAASLSEPWDSVDSVRCWPVPIKNVWTAQAPMVTMNLPMLYLYKPNILGHDITVEEDAAVARRMAGAVQSYRISMRHYILKMCCFLTREAAKINVPQGTSGWVHGCSCETTSDGCTPIRPQRPNTDDTFNLEETPAMWVTTAQVFERTKLSMELGLIPRVDVPAME